MRRPGFRLLLTAALAASLPVALRAADDQRTIDYGRDIQPILAENCFHCHGPDAGQRQADLRLDSFEGATAGDAIVPGQSDESEVVRRVFSDDRTVIMPPPRSNRTLSPAQKQLLKRWIDAGAPYSRHWAFVAPVRPALPGAPGEALIRNPIDRFVAARLEREGLSPSPPAAPEKLLRRLTLDLTGLPPGPGELEEFLADPSDAAYLEVVDRLLASGRFGERMVWEWLDAARYADTNGYQGDPTRAMWYWRDWAIEAFNQNLPFDRFTVEQLAGDLLPEPTRAQLIATGFHRNHMINGEGGRIAEESRVEYVQDRVETTGAVWMGLTLTCCRCHDHKYDPFTQTEYYRLAAYFNSIEESGANDAGGLAQPVLSMPSPELQARIDDLRQRERDADAQRQELERAALADQPQWEQSLVADGRVREARWETLSASELSSAGGAALEVESDGAIRVAGASPDQDEYRVLLHAPAAAITGLRLEALSDERLPHGGPGRAENGNFVLSELTLEAEGQPVPLDLVQADFSQKGWDAAGALDGNAGTGWAVAPEFGKPHVLLVALRTPLRGIEGNPLRLRLSFQFGSRHTLGRFRVSSTSSPRELLAPLPDSVRAGLQKPLAERSDAEREVVTRHYLSLHPRVAEAAARRDAARREREEAERAAPRTMVMRDRAVPRETFVLTKGAYNAPAGQVEHGVLEGLAPAAAGAPANRLGLARWLVAAEHPLTARVAVNRLWQQFFGTGLVKSAEDFGVQGDKPSHPELLDWLAVEFRESGWDIKRLVHLIVTSAAYRQSSRVSSALAERDPENRLLARGPRGRLPSWMLRDQALAVSGLLVERWGGPPVKGYQPPGVWEDATFGQIRYEPEHGESLYRRSLYTFWRRIVAPTVFFDVANRQNCSVKSSRTNTPLHALVTLNDVTYVEAARGLAQRILGGGGTDTARIDALFRLCTSRSPADDERARLLGRLAALRTDFARHPQDAQELLAVGESPVRTAAATDELAAWTGLALLVLNLDETLTNE